MSLVPIDEVVHFDGRTHDSSTAALSDADSTPTFDVFEENTDTPILAAQSMTKRTGLTGRYRGSFTASAANGFEAGKWYTVDMSATVGGIADSCVVAWFRCAPAEQAAGVPEVDVKAINNVSTSAVTNVKAVQGLTTADIVASVTGNVGGNIVGSVASVTAAVALTSGERTSVADAILDRDMSTGTDSGSTTVRTVRQALRALRNKWSISGGTLTVTKENDATTSWTAAVTTTAGDPVSTVDPAGP